MIDRKRLIVKSSVIGLICQLISIVLQMISRKAFIAYIGDEILGLNGTFSSILSTLSLAELGFQSAIAYNLYKPLFEKNKDDINSIVNIFRFVYGCIGGFFVIASFIMLPFLHFFLKDVEMTNDIYYFFLLQAFASSCTYFLAYKRTILYADQKEYVYKLIDMLFNIVFKAAQIIVLVRLHNYYLFLILQIFQVYISNIIVHFICKKRYPYLHKEKINKIYFRTIFKDTKEIAIGRLASYVYSSTDNLIVSKFLGTVRVAGLGNYTTVTSNLRMLVSSFLGPITPIIGTMIAEKRESEKQEKKFELYSHLRFVLILLLLVPTFVLIDDFVAIWLEETYILALEIKILLLSDIYLLILQGACTDFINAKGLFKQNRKILIVSTIINLVVSLIGVNICGMSGVLFGTVCCQLYNYFGYGYVVYKDCFNSGMRGYKRYLLKGLIYLLSFTSITAFCTLLYSKFNIQIGVVKFVLGGFGCEFLIIILYIILFSRNDEHKELYNIFLQSLRKHFKR